MSAETPLSASLGLLAFVVLVLLIAAVIANVRWPHNARPSDVEQTPVGRCSTTACRYPGRVVVLEAADLGGELRTVCQGCADEGVAHQWWTRVGVAS